MMSIEQLRFRFPRAVALAEARIAFFVKAGSFALVGAVNTVVDFGVLWIGAQIFGFPLLLANTISWIVAVTGSYVLNSMFTFAAESGRKLGWRAYATFVASGVVGYVVNTTALVFVADHIANQFVADRNAQILIGKVCAIGASFVVNFSLSHFVVFRRRVEAVEERPGV